MKNLIFTTLRKLYATFLYWVILSVSQNRIPQSSLKEKKRKHLASAVNELTNSPAISDLTKGDVF